MVALENMSPQEKTEKTDNKTEKKENVDQHSLANEALKMHQDIILSTENTTYNMKQADDSVLEVNVQGNDIRLFRQRAGMATELYTGQLDKNVFNITIPGK